MSAFIEAESFGLWTPVDHFYDRQDGGNIMVNYLRVIGTMLRDGHFKQAKIRALQVKALVEPEAKSGTSP